MAKKCFKCGNYNCKILVKSPIYPEDNICCICNEKISESKWCIECKNRSFKTDIAKTSFLYGITSFLSGLFR